MTGTVLTEDGGEGGRVLTLNRPQRLNAIVPELLEDLIAALEAAEREPAVRAFVLTGAGRAFCSGDDLKEFGGQAADEATTRAYIERIQDVTRAVVLGDTRSSARSAAGPWAAGSSGRSTAISRSRRREPAFSSRRSRSAFSSRAA